MEKDKETKATEEREGSQVNQNVVDFGSAMTKTAHGTVYTLAIIGQIEGHTAAPTVRKPPGMSTCCPCWRSWRRAGRWTVFYFC